MKIVVTSSASSITFTFNDYASEIGQTSRTVNKAICAFAYVGVGDYVECLVGGALSCTFDLTAITFKIDSVNGVAPISNADLLTKLSDILIVTGYDGDPTTIIQDSTHRFATDAEKSAWDAKQAALVSAINIKTINGSSVLGSGDLVVGGVDATKLAILNNLSDLNDAAIARTNIGLSTTANQTDSTDKRFVTDAQLTVIGNTSGTNTGDETVSTLGSKINAAAAATPNDTDLVATVDTSVVKKITWTNVKAFLKTYFDTIYATISDLNLKSNIASPTFTGTVTTPALEVTGGITNANLPNGLNRGSSADQSQVVVSATNYYITNSNINLPATLKAGMVVGTRFVWRFAMTKTNAGTGIFQISIYRGVNGSTADTQDVLQTIGTQTAANDSMVVDVMITILTTGGTGSYRWAIIPVNKAITATGFGVVTGTTGHFSGTVSSVALNTTSLIFGLGFKATTGTPTIRVPMVQAQAYNIN